MSKKTDITNILTRNVDTIIQKKHLENALASKKKLRIKHGIDPTGDKIHIGRAVVLWKLKELQNLGHKIILLIGDFTALIGDPSDKLEKRPFLSKEEVKKNLKNYPPQIGQILDLKKVEVHYNSEWLKRLDFQEISQLAESFTFQQILERKNFKDRLNAHKEISLREALYPLMQGYDSVALKADVELGGTDQLFNLTAGRKIQERYGQKPQDIIITKMLIGTDGRKMSTSWGNVINIIDKPNDMFGKVMACDDKVIIEYFELATDLPEAKIKQFEKKLKEGTNPKEIKEALALEIVKRYHKADKAKKAQEEFTKVFGKKELPKSIPTLSTKTNILDLLTTAGVSSKSEARRLVEQGGIRINDKPVKDPAAKLKLKSGDILQIGKRRFFKIK